MSHEGSIQLREQSSAPDFEVEEHRTIEQEPLDIDQTTSRRHDSNTKRACVLIGNGLLQLPIWGFAMSYGVFQEYFATNWTLTGNPDLTGIIGTTSNGVMYLSMPVLFALFTRRWARHRQAAALSGAALACASFLLSSFSTDVWHLVATQGVLAALGCALMYSPTTLSLGEWFGAGGNRALAYGVTLSCKNIAGSACPFVLRGLLDRYELRLAVRVWAALVAGTSIPAIFLVPAYRRPPGAGLAGLRARKIPWRFLRHRTIYVYSLAIALQSSGYGIPQTYLNTYAHDVALLSQTSATLLLTIFNLPGIISSSFFGYLSNNSNKDNNAPNTNTNRTKTLLSLSAPAVTSIPALGSALSAFLFWGLTTQGSMALLVLFSVTFGFFAGGYSATWGSVLDELEREARASNEAVDTGMLYGLLNGARGVGYVSGGLAGVPLLRAGMGNAAAAAGRFGYGTAYGPLIIFTGLSSVFGGWAVLWRWRKLLCLA
ncbi:Monocarboxylate transporter 12 [Cytospora mali]|uniref:Monocarboxylate transporter 12 n=1 Tax=Cytospora mali TaxID=578113 RepID=A0A194VZ10_CYTMA|nr:Monocarboxylate transporter 12 [Valsa mali]